MVDLRYRFTPVDDAQIPNIRTAVRTAILVGTGTLLGHLIGLQNTFIMKDMRTLQGLTNCLR